MKVQKFIEVRLLKKRLTSPVIDVVQYDTGVQLVFSLVDFDIPSGTTATLYVQKRSGKFVYQEKDISISGDEITIDLENQALTEHGETKYQVMLKNGTDTVTTFAGVLRIEKSLADANAVESKTVIRAFDEAVADHVSEFQTKAEQIVAACIATIPDDYTVTEAKVNELANAVKGNLSGTVVFADDVSPVEHNLVVKAKSKNLYNIDGATYEEVNNAYTASGSRLKYGKTYTVISDTPISWFKVAANHASGYGCVQKTDYANGFTSFTFVLERNPNVEDSAPLRICIDNLEQNAKGNLETLKAMNIRVVEGEEVAEYTPYIDPSTVTVTRCGKNILNPSGSKSQNGVTLTMNEDGVYTISGTTTASINLNLGNMFLKAGYKYKPVVRLFSGSLIPSFWSFEAQENMYKDSKGYLSSDVDTKASSFIYASGAGTTYDAKFTIMVEIVNDNTTDDYEPYNGAEYIPASDGTVSGLTSVSPCMTILTDTEGAIVECEYNRDTNKVIEKLTNAIKALGGTV